MLRVTLLNNMVCDVKQCVPGNTLILCERLMIKIKWTSDLRLMLIQEKSDGNIYMKVTKENGEEQIVTDDITPFQIMPNCVLGIYELFKDTLVASYKIAVVEGNGLKRKRENDEILEIRKRIKNNENVKVEVSATVDISIPTTWEPQTEECQVFELDNESDEFQELSVNFLKNLPDVGGEVTKISRIQNKRLHSWYYLRKNEIAQKPINKEKEVEKFLYHGTNNEYINHIVKEGLDPRLAKLSGSIGVGVYFAETPKTSLAYVSTNDEIKKMFLCRVALGYSEKGCKGLRRPPYIGNTEVLSDSVEGTIGNDKIWVVFDSYQTYPEYIIEFKANSELLPRQPPTVPSVILQNFPMNRIFGFVPPPYPLNNSHTQQLYQDLRQYTQTLIPNTPKNNKKKINPITI